MQLFRSLFSSDFMPHRTCYMWAPAMVLLHVICDSLIALAYFCIPIALIYFIRQRRDIPAGWVFWMFGVFIISCGLTHVMEVWTIWHADYLFAGILKAITAAFSIATAAMLVRLLPQALAWPSPTALRAVNLELAMEGKRRCEIQTVLKQNENEFRQLLDGIKDYAIYMLDTEGRIMSWNVCGTNLFGYGAGEILGRHVSCFYPASEAAHANIALESAIAHGRTEDIGQRMRKDGSTFWGESVTSPLRDGHGKLIGFTDVVHDITLRRETEEALAQQTQDLARSGQELRTLNDELESRVMQRTAQLESANKELEAFTYSVSHDLRAPLRHISGFSKILSEDHGAELGVDARKYLDRISHGARKMGILIDELLGLAGVGRHTLSLKAVRCNLLVEDVTAILAAEAEGRIIDWKISDLGVVDCDPILLAQVFQNLISNALKFTRPRATATIEISRLNDASHPTFFVRDNGVGFDMKYADKLFGVFQRLHRVEEFEGTGIGLATVRRIIQKHGGDTWAEAQLEKGATFFFSLDLPEAVETDLPAAQTQVKL